MKSKLLVLLIINQFVLAEINPQQLVLTSEELQAILTAEQVYSYFGSEISSLMSDVPQIKKYSEEENISREKIKLLCEYITRGRKTAPKELIEDALDEILSYLEITCLVPAEEIERIMKNCGDYYELLISGDMDIVVEPLENDDTDAVRSVKKYCTLRVKNLFAYKVVISGDLFVCQDVTVCGNETIYGNLTVAGTITNPQPVMFCQEGPLFVGSSDATPLNLVTNGCSNNRMIISANGGVTIEEPDGGETGLTIEGGGEIINDGDLEIVAGDLILPQAGSSGLIQLGGGDSASATNVRLYEFGTRNFFAGNGAPNLAVTGTDNVSIGSSANSTLTAANNTIAVGSASVATSNNAIAIGSADPLFTGATATASRAIALGLNATAIAAMGIAVGSASGVAGGTGASATNTNAIAIGSGNGTVAGPTTGITGVSSIALGGSDGVFAGAAAGANRTIAIGSGPIANSDASVLVGSASGVAGGLGPNTVERAAICIGSAQGMQRAANSGNTSTIAIGGSDGVFPGAAARGMRSITIGVGANTGGTGAAGAVILGSASGVVGGAAPVAAGIGGIAIGSAQGVQDGAVARGAQAIAIGGSDGVAVGAITSAARSVTIGTGANVGTNDRIVLGNVATTAVRIGIGNAAPTAKLEVVGVDGTPVTILNQVNTGIGNAPRWLNPSVSAVAGTPIHYNGSNQLFGFTSSERYKTNIRDIGMESEIIYQLTPVLYDAKEGYGEGKDIPGFIAEQICEVAPNLVIFNDDKQPENVAYTDLCAFEVKEIQKHQQKLIAQKSRIADNGKRLASLIVAVAHMQEQVNQYTGL